MPLLEAIEINCPYPLHVEVICLRERGKGKSQHFILILKENVFDEEDTTTEITWAIILDLSFESLRFGLAEDCTLPTEPTGPNTLKGE